MTPPIIKYVSPNIIRRKFKDSQYPAMIAEKKLVPKYLRNKVLTNPQARRHPEPPGTRSQVIRYSDQNGNWFVEVHQYLRPDGRLGASGKPDPKRLKISGTIYIAKSNK